MAIQTWRIEIPPEECEELLTGAVLGRLGVIVAGRPELFPVNHVYAAGRRRRLQHPVAPHRSLEDHRVADQRPGTPARRNRTATCLTGPCQGLRS